MKILEIDIETAPHSAYIWSCFTKYISPDHIEVPGYTLCFAARWKGDNKVMFHSIWTDGFEGMLDAAWQLLNEADAVIHYNGKKFDVKILNGEFLVQEWTPPAPYAQIDLLPVVRRNFRFPSNKLDYVCKRLGLGAKVHHRGMELWTEVMEGDKKSCKEMMEYNIQDVHLLTPLYERLLPWITEHPNYGMFSDSDRPVCTNCGSENLHKEGTRATKTQLYQRYQCQDCGTWLQDRMTCLDPAKRRNILKQIPT